LRIEGEKSEDQFARSWSIGKVAEEVTISQAAQKCPDARLPKSFVGNGFKPFPTMYAATSLPRA
jgi:hypothetical protein